MIKTSLDDWIGRKIGLHPGCLSREALEDFRLNRLRDTIALVKEKSAYYHKSLAMVDPNQITFAELAKLPFTFPQDIQHDPLKFICTSPKEIERIISLQSSGTTGDPKRIYFTKEDQELTIDYFEHGMRNLVGPRDRVLILLPWEIPGSVGDLLYIGLKRMNAYPILEAAKAACCHDFIMVLPDGYDTVIGEGGSFLSGGEKQRISIARAIFKDAPIVILDEATASVDPENEHDIQKAISALTKEKTVVIIAHRLATIHDVDRILVVNGGEITQQGTHKELMLQEGIYKKFVILRRAAEEWSI